MVGPLAAWRPFRSFQIRILVATWLGYAGYYFCRVNFYAVKAALQEHLGLTTVELGHIGTAYLIAYAVGQFGSALFGRWLGPRRLLLAGTALSIVANLGMGCAGGFWPFLILISLNGLAQGTGWPSCIGSLGYWFSRERRGTVLGLWSTCYQAGPFLATHFAGLMLGVLTFRWAFFGAAFLLAAIWIVIFLLHPNTPEDVGHVSIVDGAPGEPPGTAARAPLGWSRQVVLSILMMGIIYFCIKFARYLLISWTPYFLGNNFGLEGDQAAYLTTIFYACGFGGVIAAGWITDRFFGGRRALVALFMLLCMTGAFLWMALLGGTSLIVFTVGIGLAGFMLFGPDSLLSGVGAIDVGSQRGALTAAGLINGIGSLGPIFQEELVAWIYQRSGHDLGPILWLMLGVAAAGCGVMTLLWLRARRGKVSL